MTQYNTPLVNRIAIHIHFWVALFISFELHQFNAIVIEQRLRLIVRCYCSPYNVALQEFSPYL